MGVEIALAGHGNAGDDEVSVEADVAGKMGQQRVAQGGLARCTDAGYEMDRSWLHCWYSLKNKCLNKTTRQYNQFFGFVQTIGRTTTRQLRGYWSFAGIG